MMSRSAVELEIRDLIERHGRITFAQFMQSCLYSPAGGFYATRGTGISTHFGTSSTVHPVFGALIARQLEQMWRLLGDPPTFHLIEVGSGDGSLARAIMQACHETAPLFAQALVYVASDYQPVWSSTTATDADRSVQRVRSEGLRPFRNIVGCILSNELIDNLPVHRFIIQDGRVMESFVETNGEQFVEVLGEPSTPRIQERLAGLGQSLPEGYRGEVNLAMEDWVRDISRVLDRGFVLTVDYGDLAPGIYSPQNSNGTLACYRQHASGNNPYQHVGQQDITCHVDFTSLIRLGEWNGLASAGYARQSQFLGSLGFRSMVDALADRGLSAARAELNRIAMMTLVDPEEYGDFKVLVQVKGQAVDAQLLGFIDQEAQRAPIGNPSYCPII